MKNIVKIVVTFEPIIQLWCPSRLRIFRTIHNYSILLKKTNKKWNFGRYQQLQLFWQTHTQTDGHGNSITNPAQRAKSVKIACWGSDIHIHMFNVLRFTCRVSPVTCHFSLTPTATATDPPTANFPIMHSRLVCKEPQTHLGMAILAIHSSTRSLQSTRKQVFRDGTDTRTHDSQTLQIRDWIGPEGWFSENK